MQLISNYTTTLDVINRSLQNIYVSKLIITYIFKDLKDDPHIRIVKLADKMKEIFYSANRDLNKVSNIVRSIIKEMGTKLQSKQHVAFCLSRLYCNLFDLKMPTKIVKARRTMICSCGVELRINTRQSFFTCRNCHQRYCYDYCKCKNVASEITDFRVPIPTKAFKYFIYSEDVNILLRLSMEIYYEYKNIFE